MTGAVDLLGTICMGGPYVGLIPQSNRYGASFDRLTCGDHKFAVDAIPLRRWSLWKPCFLRGVVRRIGVFVWRGSDAGIV